MDFEYTPAQREFRHEFRDWLVENLPEGWLSGDREVPDDPEDRKEFLVDWQRTLHEGGWVGIHWPEEYGGRDATLWEQVIYNEELERVDAPSILNVLGITLVGPTLLDIGTEAQKERFVPNILNAEEIWCQGYSEPNSGSDLASLSCEAEETDEGFVINGQKVWTSNAHLADWCFLLTRTDESGDKHHGITALLVDMNQDGVTTEPIHQITDDRTFNETFFDDAVAKKEHVIGDVDEGWRAAMTLSGYEQTTTRVFGVERRFEEIRDYCRETVVDGRTLADDPHVAQRLAEFETKIHAAKVTYLRKVSNREADESEGLDRLDNVYTREIRKDLEDFALGLLGTGSALWADGHEGGAWTDDYLSSFGATIAGGTTDIKRNVIAERVLGLPKGFRAE